VERFEVEALTAQGNSAVVRLPDRRFPAVVVQGDSLSTIVADLKEALPAVRSGEAKAADAGLTHLLSTLEGVQRGYEAALAEHGIPLPYTK